MLADTVPLPTAVGPARTVRCDRVCGCAPGSARELAAHTSSVADFEFALKCAALLCAQAAQSAAGRDVEPLHDLRGPDLAHPLHRLDDLRDPHLADHVIGD